MKLLMLLLNVFLGQIAAWLALCVACYVALAVNDKPIPNTIWGFLWECPKQVIGF